MVTSSFKSDVPESISARRRLNLNHSQPCQCRNCRYKQLRSTSLTRLQNKPTYEIDLERRINLAQTSVNWLGPFAMTTSLLNSLPNNPRGGVYLITKAQQPIYIGETSHFKRRLNRHRLAAMRLGCNTKQHRVYIGKIKLSGTTKVSPAIRKNVESVLIRHVLRSGGSQLTNRSSVKPFKVGSGGLSVTNTGNRPPGMIPRIIAKANDTFEVNIADSGLGTQVKPQHSWLSELFQELNFEEESGLNADQHLSSLDSEFRGRRGRRISRFKSRPASRRSRRNKPRFRTSRLSRAGRRPYGIKTPPIKPGKPGKKPPWTLPPKPGRRYPVVFRPRRRPIIIREPSAPCVCPAHGTEFVRWVQSSLNRIQGLRLRVNGIMNRATRNALRNFQQREGLPTDGIAGPETEKALIEAKAQQSGKPNNREYEWLDDLEFEQEGRESEVRVNRKSRSYVQWIQQSLNKVMGINLKVDGISGRRTRSAVRSFQKRFSLKVDGIVGPQTEAMLIMLGFSVPPSTQIPSAPATGNWVIPPSVRATGEAQYVRYDSPPAWSGKPGNCSESFTPGASQLKDHILSKHPGVSQIGGYNCRVNSANRSQTSVHGVGRALDIMIPKVSGRANKAVGDPIANWLVKNGEALGVQYIIWNRTKWNGSRSGRKHGSYGGPSPHTDHIHVELNRDGANLKTAWFRQKEFEVA